MANLNLIISADYEVFGNGSGDVRTCMVAPTESLMQTCEMHKAVLTIFVDVCELWAFEEVEKSGEWDMDYSPSMLIKEQLIDAVSRGHDVQLHFHPQWLDYKYLGKGEWQLNHDKWRLPSLPAEEIDSLFKRGKETLEQLLKPVLANYECNVFRAGGWCIQPEEHVLKSMKKYGFKIESSVAPGVVNKNPKSFFDFTITPDLPFWKIDNFVTEQKEGELIEVPIYSTAISSFKKFKFLLKRAQKKVAFKPIGCTGYAENAQSKNKIQKLIRLLSGGNSMFNFSDATTAEEMTFIAKSAAKKYRNVNTEIPLVMIGHPKTFANTNELNEFLSWAAIQEEISFGKYKVYKA